MARRLRIVAVLTMFQIITKIINASLINSISPRGWLGINPDSTDLLPNIEYSSALSSSSSLPNSVSSTAYFNAPETLSNIILTQPLAATSLPASISTSIHEVQPSESTTLRLPSTADTLAISSALTPLPLMSTDLTPCTSPISVSLTLPSSSITPYTSSGHNLVTLSRLNPIQPSSSSSTSLESTSSDSTLIISSPLNVQSSTPILHTSEPLDSLSTTSTPVISTNLYLSKSILDFDRSSILTDIDLSTSFPTPVSSLESSSVPLLNLIPSSELTPVPESASQSMSEENLSIALLELL